MGTDLDLLFSRWQTAVLESRSADVSLPLRRLAYDEAEKRGEILRAENRGLEMDVFLAGLEIEEEIARNASASLDEDCDPFQDFASLMLALA